MTKTGQERRPARRRWEKWVPPKFDKQGLTRWNWMCQHPRGLKLGRYVDIGAFTYINAENGVTIGDYVQVGSHCSLYSVSTIDGKAGPVKLGRNCRLGTHTVVMPGVIVGENSIVGACSCVGKDVEENVLAYGVPARTVRPLNREEIRRP